jgi:hypothetical protein
MGQKVALAVLREALKITLCKELAAGSTSLVACVGRLGGRRLHDIAVAGCYVETLLFSSVSA